MYNLNHHTVFCPFQLGQKKLSGGLRFFRMARGDNTPGSTYGPVLAGARECCLPASERIQSGEYQFPLRIPQVLP
jgi:hypothetical protein